MMLRDLEGDGGKYSYRSFVWSYEKFTYFWGLRIIIHNRHQFTGGTDGITNKAPFPGWFINYQLVR